MDLNRNHMWVRVRNDWLPGIYGCIKNSPAFSECAADHHISESLPRPLNLLLPLQLLPLLSSVHCTSCQSYILSIVHPVNRTSCPSRILSIVSCQSRILSIACPVNSVLSITHSARSPHYHVLPRCRCRCHYYHCNYYRC